MGAAQNEVSLPPRSPDASHLVMVREYQRKRLGLKGRYHSLAYRLQEQQKALQKLGKK